MSAARAPGPIVLSRNAITRVLVALDAVLADKVLTQ
jgi:hypothetical protein